MLLSRFIASAKAFLQASMYGPVRTRTICLGLLLCV